MRFPKDHGSLVDLQSSPMWPSGKSNLYRWRWLWSISGIMLRTEK